MRSDLLSLRPFHITKTLCSIKKQMKSKILTLFIVMILLGCINDNSSYFIDCNDKRKIIVKLPHDFTPNNLCEYYSWAKFFENGNLISKDSSATIQYCLNSKIDSVSIYANGYGYTIIDTTFRMNQEITTLETKTASNEYFQAHWDFLNDLKKGNIVITTEDKDYSILDSVYHLMSDFKVEIEYVPWREPGRDYRFTFNCVAEEYLFNRDSVFMTNLPLLLDSIRYIELDQLGGKKIDTSDISILMGLEDFNLDITSHTLVMYKYNYQEYYISEIEKNKKSKESIIDSLINGSNYSNIRFAEVFGYANVDVLTRELINLLEDTTFVGLSNSADLVYSERVNSGYLKFYGHGCFLFDDIFTVCGRANHVLYKITNTRLGNVRINPKKEYLNKLKCRWETYLGLINEK